MSQFLDRVLRVARAFLPTFAQSDLTCGPSRHERLGLIFSAIDRYGTDCPACAIWALEQDRFWTARDTEPTERRSPC